MSWSPTPLDPIHALVLMETAYPLRSHEVPLTQQDILPAGEELRKLEWLGESIGELI